MKQTPITTAGMGEASSFSRSLLSLDLDGFRNSLLRLLLVVVLLGAWVAWFFLARVTRYEVTDRARLEVDQATYFIQAPIAGRVVSTRLVVGHDVKAGDVLVEVDTDSQKLQIEEERTRLAALSPQITALHQEIDSLEQARRKEQQASEVAVAQSRAQYREAETLARFAEQELERLRRLHSQGLIAERDFAQGMVEAERRNAAAESRRLAARRLEGEQKTREGDRQAHLDRLHGDLTKIKGQQTTTTAAIERLRYEIERRQIRAPVAGRIGEVAILRAGAFVQEGDRLGAVVPPGRLKGVAMFFPQAAMGRIRPGQPARIRLDGFPWSQYGSISASVANVASEVREGWVRVELSLNLDPTSKIPRQHGLPGTAEVEVERISPAMLVLRAAGQLVAAPKTASDAQMEDSFPQDQQMQ